MAIELDNRTKILAGVVVLAAVAAGAWFFLFQDDAPAPKTVVAPPAASAAKAAADAAKAAPEAAKAAAPAPAAGKPAAKPIPTNPDQLIAEVIEASGVKSQFQAFGREVVLQADAGDGPGAAETRAVVEIFERVFEPGKMTAELAGNLKNNVDVERMGRFLELLRQPIALKMTSEELRKPSPEAVKEFSDNFRKNPPPASRVKLIQALDDVTRTSEVAVDMSSAIARSMVDTMLAELQKAGKNVPKEARQMVGSQLNAMRNQARTQIRTVLYVTYRNATDEELSQYVKLLDADTGRWGTETLANAIRPVLVSRGSALGAEVGKLAMARRTGALAKAPPPAPAAEPAAKAQAEAPAPKPAVATAPAAPVGYQRPANVREIYTRYNDLISATVMRDRAAIKELLDDRKFPDIRQKDGTTPLMIAAANGDADIATMLLAKGADPNRRANGGVTALSIAKSRGSAGAEMVQLLQRSGAKE